MSSIELPLLDYLNQVLRVVENMVLASGLKVPSDRTLYVPPLHMFAVAGDLIVEGDALVEGDLVVY